MFSTKSFFRLLAKVQRAAKLFTSASEKSVIQSRIVGSSHVCGERKHQLWKQACNASKVGDCFTFACLLWFYGDGLLFCNDPPPITSWLLNLMAATAAAIATTTTSAIVEIPSRNLIGDTAASTIDSHGEFPWDFGAILLMNMMRFARGREGAMSHQCIGQIEGTSENAAMRLKPVVSCKVTLSEANPVQRTAQSSFGQPGQR